MQASAMPWKSSDRWKARGGLAGDSHARRRSGKIAMATQTRTSSPGGKGPSGEIVGYDRFIDMQLRKTRSQVRTVAIALVDHWIIPGGLGFLGRLLFLAVFLAGAGTYFVRQVAPLLLRRINPVYAAHTIENSKPSLKNSLINFLLFRQRRAELPDVI